MNMTREFSYKLGHYKITEVVGGGLSWETHHGLGNIRKGKCLIEGNILIIGPSEAEEPGFLKREFMAQMDELSNWDKTKYYCLSHSIHKCRTGGRLSFLTKMDEHVGATLNAEKVPVSGSVGNKEMINKQPDEKKEFRYFKEKVAELWNFFKQWSSKG
jgi:hypothetical protein